MMSLVDAITDKIILRFRFLLFYGVVFLEGLVCGGKFTFQNRLG